MTTYSNNYYILKNGERMDEFSPRPLPNVIWLVQKLEAGIDREKEHSPYTIMKEEASNIIEFPSMT